MAKLDNKVLFEKLKHASSEEEKDIIANQIFENNKNLIYYACKNFRNMCSCVVDFEDIEQVAAIAMWKAIKRYEPEKAEFVSYAMRCMQNEVFLQHRNLNNKISQSRTRAIKRLKQKGIDIPTLDQIREEMGVSEFVFASAMPAVSLDASFGENNKGEEKCSLLDLLESDENIESDYAQSEKLSALNAAIATLTPKEQMIIKMYFFLNMKHSQIAEKVGVTQSCISRTITNIIKKLSDVLSLKYSEIKSGGGYYQKILCPTKTKDDQTKSGFCRFLFLNYVLKIKIRCGII